MRDRCHPDLKWIINPELVEGERSLTPYDCFHSEFPPDQLFQLNPFNTTKASSTDGGSWIFLFSATGVKVRKPSCAC